MDTEVVDSQQPQAAVATTGAPPVVTPATPAPQPTSSAAGPVLESPAPVVPATPAEPELPLTPATPELDPREQYIRGLEQQQAAAQEQIDQQGLTGFLADTAKDLQENGMEPEQANEVAGQIGQAHWQAYQAIRQVQANTKRMVTFVQEAAELADAHKIPIMHLLRYPTLSAMRQAVKGLEAQQAGRAKVAKLEAEVAALRKGQVPAQTFAAGQGAPSGATMNYAALLKSGKPLPSAAEIDRMTAQYLRG